MNLILKRTNAIRRGEGKPEYYSSDDFTIFDGELVIGWIQAQARHGLEARKGWRWSLNLYGHTLPDSGGFVDSLEEAKAAFKKRYVEVRPQILEWASTYVDHVWKQG